jgi:hypothetical protein
VILPDSLPAQLSRDELDHVLLHETAHLARWDDWTGLLTRVLDAALALHPVATWILRRIEIEREHSCDEWVVTRTESAKPYARSLMRLYELRFSRHQAALLASGILTNGSRLGRRIEMLLSQRREFTARVSILRVGAICGVLLALAAVESLSPRWIGLAQAPKSAFDVASIKRHKEEGGGFTFAARPGGRLTVVNNPISNVIGNAYGIAPYQLIGAPDWIDSERYDIEARARKQQARRR